MRKEFKVNSLISLRLVDDKTILYIKGKEFKQCKILLLNIPTKEVELSQELKSIDEAVDRFGSNKEIENMKSIDPETEFWGHCSNVQAWVENNYDTDLLHRSLAFPLLKTLSEEGDKLARQKFKEEIARRYKYGNYSVQAFLFNEGYLSYLSDDGILNGILSPKEAIFMEKVMRYKKYSLIPCFDLRRDVEGSNHLFMSIENGRIKELELEIDGQMSEIPNGIESLKNLNNLTLYVMSQCDNLFGEKFCSESIKILILDCYVKITIPDYFYYFVNLEKLRIRGMIQGVIRKPTISLEESFTKLNQLKSLYLSSVKISAPLDAMVNLKKLKSLSLVYTSLRSFPFSIIESLNSLEWIELRGIKLTEKEIKKLEKRKIELY